MDTADPDDVSSLQSSFHVERPERYELDELPASPVRSRSNLSQVFDFGSILRSHPRKYEILWKQDLKEDGTVVSGQKDLQKKEPLTQEFSDKQHVSKRQKDIRDAFLKKKSASHGDMHLHNASQTGYKDEREKSSSLHELMGSDATDSEDEGSMARRHSFELLDEQPELTTFKLPDGTTVHLPDVDALRSGQSSAESSPRGTPSHSPRMRPKHDAMMENMNCVPVTIQSDKKRLFGIGPEYQPPSEQLCIKKEDARQIGLLQRVVREGFTTTSRKTFFHQKEDIDFFPLDKPMTMTAVDEAKSVKSRFMSKAEMNFLSPSSM